MKKEDLENIQKLIEDINEGWGPFLSPKERQDINTRERERLAAAQRSARETVDRRQGRASINPQTGLRYTVQPGNVRRSEGQEATLNDKKVQWAVDKTGKGSWVPRYDSEGEQARSQNVKRITDAEFDKKYSWAMGKPKPEPKTEPALAPRPVAPAPKPEKTYDVGNYGSLTKSQINQKYKQLSGDEAVKFGKAANQAIYKWNEGVESGPILPGEKGKRVFPKGQEPKPTGAKLPPLQNAGYEPEGELTEKMIYDMIIEYLVSNGHAEDLHEAHYLIERHDVDSLVRIVESCGCEHEEMEDEKESNKKKKKKVSEDK